MDAELNSADLSVRLPKFSFETEASLKEPLEEMNMVAPFLPDADFGGAQQWKFFVSGVFHKTFVAVEGQC